MRSGRSWILFVSCLISAALLAACAPTPTRESPGEWLDDSTITAKVKAKFLIDPVVSFFAISVETFRGVVLLSGFVNTAEQRDRAIALAKEVPGVKEVQSNLVIKPKP